MYVPTEQQLKYRILKFLQTHSPASISEIARATEAHRVNVRDKLYLLKRYGYVKDRLVRQVTTLGYWIQVHEWEITKEGEKWLTGK